MKKLLNLLPAFVLALGLSTGMAKDEKKCPVSGEPVNPKCTLKYEGKTHSFCCGKCRKKFDSDLKASLYHRLGGKKAINAAVDLFYTKVLADENVNHFFEDVNMKRQHNKQKAFLAAAFGGPIPWTGKDMRAAHKNLDLKESDFGAIAGHLQATLKELKVNPKLIGEAMAIAASTKDAVLNRKAKK